MKAKRTKPGKMVHPEWQKGSNGPRFLHFEKGEEFSHPDCWRLCLGGSASAVPADRECSEKVLSVLGNPARQAYLAELESNTQPDRLKQFSKGEQERLTHLAEQYADELTKPEVEEDFSFTEETL